MKLPLLRFVLILASLTSVQCTRAPEAARDSDSLYVALSAPPQTLDPRITTDATGMRLAHLLFSSLVRLGPDLEIIGEAAESWEYLPESKTFRFILHEDLKFSNGREVTYEDYLFSFEEYRKPTSPFHAATKVIKDVQYRMKSNGKFYLDLILHEYSATLLTDLTPMKILPKKEIQEGVVDFRENLVGSGPYTLAEWTDQQIVLERRENPYAYFIPRLVFKIVRDDTTRVQRLLRGEIDIVQADIPLEKVGTFKSKPDEFNVHEYSGLSMTYLLLNLKDPTLSDLKVRKVLSHIIDPSPIIQYKFDGLAERATSILSPQNPYHHSGLSPYKVDLAQAEKLLKEVGLPEQTTLSLKTSNAPAVVDHARVLASQLDQAGVTTKLQSFEWATFYSDISKGNFQMALMKWVGATDPDIYRIAFHSKELPPGRNRGSYLNADLDRLLDEGVLLDKEAARKLHYQKIQEIVYDAIPIIPLWYEKQVAIAHKRVTGYRPSANGDFTRLVWAKKNQSKE